MAEFEARLRHAWEAELPQVPAHLTSYRQDWLDTFATPPLEATATEFLSAMRQAPLLLVSDYHASARSRRGLATILATLASDQPLQLVLELLPLGTTITAQLALAGGGPDLINGESLLEAYGPVLELLAARRGSVIGAWHDGSIQQRDRVTADLLQRLHRPGRRHHTVFHGGDWHLATKHLPRLLEQRGLEVTVLHQSPEPLWPKHGLAADTPYLKLATPGHWAWMETPPLHLWASLLQDIRRGDIEEQAEGMSELVTAAADCLAELLGLEATTMELSYFAPARWEEFHALLPSPMASAFEAQYPPRRDLVHPHRPWLWSPRSADLNLLMRAAAHLLLCEVGHVHELGPRAELQRATFREAAARLGNPFLRPLDGRLEAEALFRSAERAPALARAATHVAVDQLESEALDPGLELLTLRLWASRLAQELLQAEDFRPHHLRQLLFGREGGFDWGRLTATIRAAR